MYLFILHHVTVAGVSTIAQHCLLEIESADTYSSIQNREIFTLMSTNESIVWNYLPIPEDESDFCDNEEKHGTNIVEAMWLEKMVFDGANGPEIVVVATCKECHAELAIWAQKEKEIQ